MSKLTCLVFLFMIISCGGTKNDAKYIVTTKVEIKPGEVNDVLELFKATNPELVKNEGDWIKAVFSKNVGKSSVMVQAYWKSKEAYLKFSKSDKFQHEKLKGLIYS